MIIACIRAALGTAVTFGPIPIFPTDNIGLHTLNLTFPHILYAESSHRCMQANHLYKNVILHNFYVLITLKLDQVLSK